MGLCAPWMLHRSEKSSPQKERRLLPPSSCQADPIEAFLGGSAQVVAIVVCIVTEYSQEGIACHDRSGCPEMPRYGEEQIHFGFLDVFGWFRMVSGKTILDS